MPNKQVSLAVVIPAAGVGKRMQANCPKQYLTINNKTILEHTLERLISHPMVTKVVIALGEHDGYFADLPISTHKDIVTVIGGNERVDSVLAGLKILDCAKYPWVFVHDAARPCITHDDISKLIDSCLSNNIGGLLATPVRDTMKQANTQQVVEKTIERSVLWHAYTPQMYPTAQLTEAISIALANKQVITDESSAMELAGYASQLIEGRSDNIKITKADDLALAAFILQQQKLLNNSQEALCE